MDKDILFARPVFYDPVNRGIFYANSIHFDSSFWDAALGR
jgi:hypothetical protein